MLAIVLARDGKGKNWWPLGGKRVVDWTIEYAWKHFDNVVISTDSEREGRASDCTFIKRPVEISGDTANPYDAVNHVLYCMSWGGGYVVLDGDKPFRWDSTAEEAKRMQKGRIVAVTRVGAAHPDWMLDENFVPLNPDPPKQRQGLRVLYRYTGSLVMVKPGLEGNGYVIEEDVLGIDSKSDYDYLRWLCSRQRNG